VTTTTGFMQNLRKLVLLIIAISGFLLLTSCAYDGVSSTSVGYYSGPGWYDPWYYGGGATVIVRPPGYWPPYYRPRPPGYRPPHYRPRPPGYRPPRPSQPIARPPNYRPPRPSQPIARPPGSRPPGARPPPPAQMPSIPSGRRGSGNISGRRR